jgi:hypothetical protein
VVKDMGRLTKETRDKIKDMLEKDYTAKEIKKELNCSESSIYRIKKQLKAKAPTTSIIDSQIYVLFGQLLYNIVYLLEFSPYFDAEIIVSLTRDIALELTKKLVGLDKQLGEKTFFESIYYQYVENYLITNGELSKKEAQFRSKWIELLKKYYPEKLVEFFY